jgi:adenine/guanine phosphoribosyltransferase-like PRPP-binding protein
MTNHIDWVQELTKKYEKVTKLNDECHPISFRSYENTFDMLNSFDFNPYDVIVGLPRSGAFFALREALRYQKPFFTPTEWDLHLRGGNLIKRSRVDIGPKKNLEVIIFDDSINSGGTMQLILKELPKFDHINYTLFCIYGRREKIDLGDYICLERLDHPRLFEWNFNQHPYSEYIAIDLDGILCEDPPGPVNDDGDLYKNWILAAPTLMRFTHPIGAIITSRLEKFRDVTEEWLRKNSIRYKNLYMLDVPTPKIRTEYALHAKFKSLVASKIEAWMYIESEQWQAKEIAKTSNIPVLHYDQKKKGNPIITLYTS